MDKLIEDEIRKQLIDHGIKCAQPAKFPYNETYVWEFNPSGTPKRNTNERPAHYQVLHGCLICGYQVNTSVREDGKEDEYVNTCASLVSSVIKDYLGPKEGKFRDDRVVVVECNESLGSFVVKYVYEFK